MNPVWAILVVNIIALFAVPFLTYRYSHKNNLKILREKWISELREAATNFLEASECLYYANDVLYESTNTESALADEVRKTLQKRKEEGQARITGAEAKIRLLFKQDDGDHKLLQNCIDKVVKGVDEPTKVGNMFHIDLSKKNAAQKEYLDTVNVLLHKHWNEITK